MSLVSERKAQQGCPNSCLQTLRVEQSEEEDAAAAAAMAASGKVLNATEKASGYGICRAIQKELLVFQRSVGFGLDMALEEFNWGL